MNGLVIVLENKISCLPAVLQATTHAHVRRRLLTRMRSCYKMAGPLNEVIDGATVS